jgi:hypothetical protein
MGEWRYSTTILQLCSRLKWVVGFIPRTPWHWDAAKKKEILPLPEIEPGGHLACSYTDSVYPGS